jgi:hypothetical protein
MKRTKPGPAGRLTEERLDVEPQAPDLEGQALERKPVPPPQGPVVAIEDARMMRLPTPPRTQLKR